MHIERGTDKIPRLIVRPFLPQEEEEEQFAVWSKFAAFIPEFCRCVHTQHVVRPFLLRVLGSLSCVLAIFALHFLRRNLHRLSLRIHVKHLLCHAVVYSHQLQAAVSACSAFLLLSVLFLTPCYHVVIHSLNFNATLLVTATLRIIPLLLKNFPCTKTCGSMFASQAFFQEKGVSLVLMTTASARHRHEGAWSRATHVRSIPAKNATWNGEGDTMVNVGEHSHVVHPLV